MQTREPRGGSFRLVISSLEFPARRMTLTKTGEKLDQAGPLEKLHAYGGEKLGTLEQV